MNRTIVVLAGPTAVGKTQYSIDLALALGGEIVSCDSMQLYKYMDIGSAKPTPEERAKVNHYLIDEIDPKGHFTVARYSALAKKAINEIFEKGKVPIITGGTGLYLNSLLYDMDFGPVQHDQNYRKKLEALLTIESPRMFHRRLEAVDKEAADRIHEN
ncbi:MAG: tRNA (adenosine(37)-N6)-dimethylallyltransferase MiaA, partial [Anaerovoracaceae bacterium]